MAGQAIEPDAEALLRHHPAPETHTDILLASIAISLYRIANAIETTDPRGIALLAEGLRNWMDRGGFK